MFSSKDPMSILRYSFDLGIKSLQTFIRKIAQVYLELEAKRKGTGNAVCFILFAIVSVCVCKDVIITYLKTGKGDISVYIGITVISLILGVKSIYWLMK